MGVESERPITNLDKLSLVTDHISSSSQRSQCFALHGIDTHYRPGFVFPDLTASISPSYLRLRE